MAAFIELVKPRLDDGLTRLSGTKNQTVIPPEGVERFSLFSHVVNWLI